MRGKKWTRLEKLLFLTPLLMMAPIAARALLWPGDRVFRADVAREQLGSWDIFRVRETRCSPTCQSNLRQIGLGFLQYEQDFDEHLPPVASGGASFGWADAIQPYLKSLQDYQCPQIGSATSTNPKAGGYTDYFFNANLSAQRDPRITKISNTILAAEGNDGVDLTDARYNKSSLPPLWMKSVNSPARRHLSNEVWAIGGANYLFADGHVKSLPPEKISSSAPTNNNYTFAPR